MKAIFTITKFTMQDILSRKSFRVSTIIVLLLIIIGFNVPNILKSVAPDIGNNTPIIVDRDHVFSENLAAINQRCDKNNVTSCPQYEITQLDDETIKQQISNGEISSAIIIEKSNNVIILRYLTKNLATSTPPTELISQLKSLYQNLQITKLNLTSEQLANINSDFELILEQTDTETIGGNIATMMILSCVLFFAIYFCAYQVSSSVTVEKTSKIIETLVTSTSPRAIIIGKTLGIGIVGLLQVLLFAITAVISAYSFLEPEILQSLFDISNLTPYLAIITIIYFILGYFVYAFAYALTGATISKPEDIQSANTPVVILTMIGFYLAYFTLLEPTGELSKFAALLPISSPFCMPLRVMMGITEPREVILSIVILAITCLAIAYIAIKIYSNAILHSGTRMSWSDIIKSLRHHS